MPFVRFSFRNSFYLILLSISSLAQFKIIEQIENTPQIIFMLLDSISLLFLVILEAISIYFYQKNTHSSQVEPQNQRLHFTKSKLPLIIGEDTEEIQYQNKKKKVILMIILGMLSSLNSSLTYIVFFGLFMSLNGAFCFLNLLLTYLILRIWSKWQIHRHHILALVILLIPSIGAMAMQFQKIIVFFELFGDPYFVSIGTVFIIISQSFREVLEKYAMEVMYMKHFRLLFYEGVVSLVINLLLFGILQLFNCETAEISDIISLYTFCVHSQIDVVNYFIFELFGFISISSLYVALYVIAMSLINTFRVLVNKTHGSTHRYTADLLSFALFTVIDIITVLANPNDEEQIFNWANVLIIVFLIIGCLIYNENIQIVICNLSVNTRNEIEKRAITDILISNDTNEDLLEDSNWSNMQMPLSPLED